MTDVQSVTRHTGLSLRMQRISRDVLAKDLATAMDVSPGWVSRLESRRVVPDASAEKYLRALATFPTVTTPSEPASAA